MKRLTRRCATIVMICVMMLSLTGCALFDGKDKVYSRYLVSLLDINYKNVSKDYMTLTGVTQKDAEAVYVANMDYQAHSLMNYYGVKEVDDGTILSEFYYLAQAIFANAKYEVTDVIHDKDTDSYTLELTVYPLDTLETTYDSVVSYIEDFNVKVDEGDYNNTTEVDYETEFAEGIIAILKTTAESPGYMDPVVLQIPIKPMEDYYYITDEDFLTIDSHVLFVRENPKIETPASDDAEAPADNVETDGDAE